MKKSKIILPAIALLAVSGIASVTGTVAWFTAASAATVTANNVAAISTSGDLDVKVHAGNGVNGTNGSDGFLSSKTFNLYDLRDASCDITGSSATFAKAVIDSDDDGNAEGVVSSYQAVSNTAPASTWVDGSTTKNIYYAAEWDLTFTTTASYGTYDLFFDGRAAKSNLGDTTHDIYKSFRVAMICGDNKIVWAPAGTSETPDTYINSSLAVANYGDIFLSGNHGDTHFNSASSQSAAEGDITFLSSGMSSASSVTVKCIAWFEGSDPNCISVNSNNIENFDATSLALSFYAVSWSTGA